MKIVDSLKRVLFLAIVLATFGGCSSKSLPAGVRGEPFLLSDQSQQEEIIEVLKERNLPFDIDSEGYIVYLLANQAEIHGILRTVQYGDVLRDNVTESAILANEDVRKIYEAAFVEEEIPYDIRKHDGLIEIEWNQLHGIHVDRLRQRVDTEIVNAVVGNARPAE